MLSVLKFIEKEYWFFWLGFFDFGIRKNW